MVEWRPKKMLFLVGNWQTDIIRYSRNLHVLLVKAVHRSKRNIIQFKFHLYVVHWRGSPLRLIMFIGQTKEYSNWRAIGTVTAAIGQTKEYSIWRAGGTVTSAVLVRPRSIAFGEQVVLSRLLLVRPRSIAFREQVVPSRLRYWSDQGV